MMLIISIAINYLPPKWYKGVFRFGGMPADVAEASMRLFAAELLPEIRTWGTAG